MISRKMRRRVTIFDDKIIKFYIIQRPKYKSFSNLKSTNCDIGYGGHYVYLSRMGEFTFVNDLCSIAFCFLVAPAFCVSFLVHTMLNDESHLA